ncbi:MAG TPA: HEAT repeat domain-containing protein [Vicinamibacterales bacterium]|nr:HEAT repeat domain-containing protein [Vicinamibacterales bacterium]
MHWTTKLAVAAAVALAAVLNAEGLPRRSDDVATAGQERGPSPASPQDLRAAIDRLGDLDYDTRTKAARLVRRTPAPQVVPALLQAAQEHADGYVRYKSLVLLTGFDDPRTVDQMIEVLDSPNDRLREVAYRYFERFPNPSLTARFLGTLDKEQGEFVRPALVRALAAIGDDPKMREALLRDVMRGADFFRSTVIEALGDFKRGYAVPRLMEVARLDGPLQDDAALALGKIGDKRALEVLAGLQRTGGRTLQPSLAAAICLLGVNCSSHLGYLQKVLAFADDNPGYQALVRAASFGLDAVAIQGSAEALDILFTAGIPSMDPIRAPLALSVAKVALRNTPLMLKHLSTASDPRGAIDLLAEGFDMLQEDLEEEHFFVTVRKEYWTAAEGSPMRRLAEQLIGKLDF